jgi:hypothetical protein
MFRWQRFHLALAIYELLVSVSAFASAYALFLIPSDPGNGIFLGISFQRLVMLGGAILAGIFSAVVAVKAYRDTAWSKRVWLFLFEREVYAKGIRWGTVIALFLGLTAFATPLYRFGDFQDYFTRVSPLIAWVTFTSSLTFVVAWVEKYGLHWQNFLSTLHAQREILGIALISAIAFALIWILVAKTGMGLWVSDGYWYGAGVPILVLQILIAFAIGIGVLFLERSSLKAYFPTWLDFFVFFLLWGITAFFWSREPLRSSFFAPGPYLPDNAYHPYSDAATFDIGSQFALIGQGINNGIFFDRALYMAFLVFLHAFAGQDYVQVVALQAAIYAIFPAILYLLGKSIYNRSFGVILAILATLRGINGIAAGSMINLANQKQMLTDFPTVIFVAWFALLIVRWLKSPTKNYHYALWAGGVVGLAIMLRTNTLFLMLFALLLAAVVYRNQKLRGILVGFLLVLTMFASTFAWGMYNDKSIFDVYIYRIGLVIKARYPQSTIPTSQGNDPTLIGFASRDQGSIAATSFNMVSTFHKKTGIASPIQQVSAPPSLIKAGIEKAKDPPIPVFLTIHFLHNIIASIFILPTDFEFHDLRHTLKYGASYWQSYWDGNLTFGAGFFLILNLLLIALGIGSVWKSARLSGLVPLGIFLFYNLTNALARTSGGRYVVPIDWIVLFYFSLGLFQVMLWSITLFGFKDERAVNNITMDQNVNSTPWTWEPLKKAPWIVLIFILIGSSLPLSEQFFPRRYPVQTQSELLTLLEQKGYLQEMGFDKATLIALSDQWPAFRVINGRVLYPRYFWENEGIPKKRYPYGVMGFPRIAFTVIGPNGGSSVILPQDDVINFPNASDVIVLGCQGSDYLDALAVVVIENQAVVYVRSPSSPLQCPLQQPVCGANHICQ